MTTTVTPTDLDELAAVIEHAKQHDLADTISSVAPGENIITPIVYVRGVRAFIRWGKSLRADEVESTETGYFLAAGKLLDGRVFQVQLGDHNAKNATAQSLEVLLGVRCSSCTQRLDDSEPTTPVGDLGERIHDACACPLVTS